MHVLNRWLLADPDMKVRSMYPMFIDRVNQYFAAFMEEIRDLQVSLSLTLFVDLQFCKKKHIFRWSGTKWSTQVVTGSGTLFTFNPVKCDFHLRFTPLLITLCQGWKSTGNRSALQSATLNCNPLPILTVGQDIISSNLMRKFITCCYENPVSHFSNIN